MNKKKILYAGIIAGIILIGLIITICIFSNRKMIVCKSSSGMLALMYNDKEVVNFATSGKMSYNMQNQNSYIKKVGMDKYIIQFKQWFKESTGGSCL